MIEQLRILIVEDLASDVELLKREIAKRGIIFESRVVELEQEFVDALHSFQPEIVLSDYSLPRFNGMNALKLCNELTPFVPFILITGSINEETAVKCMHEGADDYILKDNLTRVGPAILSAIDRKATLKSKMEAEKALRESEAKYREIFENIQDVFYRVDTQGKIIEISPSIIRYSGYTREELIGKPVVEVYYSSDERNRMLNELQKSGKLIDYDIRLKTKDGQIKWGSLNIHFLFDQQGNPTGIEGSLRDVTERKRMEMVIKQSEENYRQLSDATFEAIFISENGICIGQNSTAERMFGYTLDEALGHYGTDWIHPGYWETVMNNMLSGAEKPYEVVALRKDGTTFPCEIQARMTKVEDRHIRFTVLRDITDRKRAEDIKQVLYNIASATFSTVDVEGLIDIIQHELGKLIDTSNFYVAFYDEDKDLLRSHYWKDQIDTIQTWLAEKSLTGIIIRKNKSLLLKKQEVLDMQSRGEIGFVGPVAECWLGVPLHKDEKVIGAFVIQSYTDPQAYSIRDAEMLEFVSHQISISLQRKKAEQDLYAAMEKARESDRLKSVFLANISHEIRTPMNAILGFTELLREPGNEPDAVSRYTEIISNSGKRLMHIIDDIIDLSKLEAKQVHISISPCDVPGLLKSIIETFRGSVLLQKKPEIALLLTLPEENAIPVIATDPLRLQQVLDNLITNAVKYSNSGIIETGVRVLTTHGTQYLEFFVKDMGVGIPSDKLALIFERFRQVDEFGYHEGAGLGLSISKALVELLGGEIHVTSELGKGTTFLFTIPLVTAASSGF